jgi:D-amino peptidase
MADMKAFISIDIEGIPYIVSRHHTNLNGELYSEARQIMTDCLVVVVDSLFKLGFESAVVADSHGPMVNILPERLPDQVALVRGYPRATSMVAGAKGCDAAFFLGYHAKPGTPNANFDHVMSSLTLRSVRVNGEDCSEFLLNGAFLGELGIPVVMVAGDKALLEDDVKRSAPWAARAILKESLGRYSSISLSPTRIAEILRNACKEAVETIKNKEARLLRFEPPVNLEIQFTSTAYAEIAAHLPNSVRSNGTTVSYKASSMSEAYLVMELLTMAANGVRSQVEA